MKSKTTIQRSRGNASAANDRELLRPMHQPPGPGGGHLLAGATHVALVVLSIIAWEDGYWPATVLLWFAIAWMGHAALSRLHESAHRMLFRSRVANELTGVLIGVLALTPLSVYRYVHAQHHQHLGREKDPEFWPYNLPNANRRRRLTYAWIELLAGWIVTPILYSVRTARAWKMHSRRVRMRLLLEWSLMVGFWAILLSVVDQFHAWSWLWVGHLAPAWIAGSMQTVRKFTEHLGRFGNTIPEMTRTVVYAGPVGRAASKSQLHVEHHGAHHSWPGIAYRNLPEATPIVYGPDWHGRTYSSHWAAMCDMLPWLLDPRLGPQWLERPVNA